MSRKTIESSANMKSTFIIALLFISITFTSQYHFSLLEFLCPSNNVPQSHDSLEGSFGSRFEHLNFATTESQRDGFLVGMIILGAISVLLLSILLVAVIIIVITFIGGFIVIVWMNNKMKNNETTTTTTEEELEKTTKDFKKYESENVQVVTTTRGFEDLYYLKLVLRNLKLETYFDVFKSRDLYAENLTSVNYQDLNEIFEDENDRNKFIVFLEELNDHELIDEDEDVTTLAEEKRELTLDISEEIAKVRGKYTPKGPKDPRSEKVLSILQTMSDDGTTEESSDSESESYICAIPVNRDFDKTLIVKRGRLVSSGSYGTIETAYLDLGDEDLTIVAVKCITLRKRVTENFVRSEVSIMKRLKHQYLLNCFGCFREDDTMYIVMEYIKSGDLFTLKNMLGLDKKIEYLRQIVDGMIYLHSKNIIHRDLKTQNILLSKGKYGENIKICDFGTSKDRDEISQTMVGTIEYLAPEVFNPRILSSKKNRKVLFLSKDVKKLIDIYAFGVMIWELICGRQPFIPLRRKCNNNQFDMLRRINEETLRPDLRYFPIDGKGESRMQLLRELMEKCWEKFPLKRPKSFIEIKEYMDKHMGDRLS